MPWDGGLVMGKKKSGLEDSNLYQRRVVAWRVAEMLAGDALGRPRPDVIRVEVDEAGDWDDLQEQIGARIDRWQVKRQQEALPAETLRGLMEALRGQPGVVGHILFMSDVEIRSVSAATKGRRAGATRIGTLRELRAMSDRWRGQVVAVTAAEATLTADERPLFEAIGRWLGDAAEAVHVLSRLTVERARTIADLEHEGKEACSRVFENGGLAWAQITTRVEEVRHGEQELRPGDLWRRLEGGALKEGLRAPQHVRDAYLSSVRNRVQAEHPLSGLAAAALDLPLWELWVERAVTWDQLEGPSSEPMDRYLGAQMPSPGPHGEGAAAPSTPRTETRRDDLRRLLVAPPGRLLAILGEAGSGKSQLLRRCWADLADVAMKDPQAAVPFFLRAQDLTHSTVAEVIPSLVGPEAARVHRQHDARIYLVDGLDEVAPHDQPQVRERLRDLVDDPRTLAVAVTCRPSHRVQVPPDAVALWLEPWSESDAEQLMARWERYDAEAVRRLRETPHAASLTTSPLILSLALWVAHDEPEALRSRSRVFSRVVEKLALGWPEGRGAEQRELADRWEELQPPLSTLAWQMICEGAAELERTSVESHLRRVRPARLTLWLDWADRQLGLLMRTGTGGYAFLLRPLAEHLAGLHLATRDDAEILTASDQLWGAEVVRHALGALADQGDQARVQRLISALVEGWERDFQTALGLRLLVRPMHLRRVLVAARACADVGEAVASQAELLAEVFWSYLSEETSVWVGDRMAAAVEEIAAAGGPVWEQLRAAVVHILTEPAVRPCLPDAADLVISPGEALWLTLHRDPQVRAAVAVHLAPLTQSPSGWRTLAALLSDTESAFWVAPLGIQLARHLRLVDRDLMPSEMRDMFSNWLGTGRTLAAQLAAIVLRPGEAPPEQLAAGLMLAATGHHSTLDLVRELGATADGAQALDAIRPDWRDSVDRQNTDGPTPHRLRAVSLVSQVALRRLGRCLGAERHRDADSVVMLTRLAQAGQDEAAQSLCRLGLTRPDALRPLLAGRRNDEPDQELRRTFGTWSELSFEAQALLRMAIERHPTLREPLVELWARLQGEHELITWFPGAALEEMVLAGDPTSTEIYASWIGTAHRYRVPAQLQGVPAVKEALREDALRTWRWATVPDDKGVVGSAAIAGESLADLWAHWADTEVLDGVFQWLEAAELEQVYGALCALSGVSSQDPRLAVVVERFRYGLQRLLGEDGRNAALRRVQVILKLRSSELREHLLDTLTPLLDAERADIALAAAAVLMPFLDAEAARTVVEALAAEWPQGAWLPQLDEAMTPLVLAHPAAFTERIIEISDRLPHEALRLVVSVQHLLSAEQRASVVTRVRGVAQTPFPWQAIGSRQLRRARLLDLLDQLTFDLGQPLRDR